MKIKSCASIEEGVRACFGEDVSITGRSYVGGGDINDSFCLSLSNGERVFVKETLIN